LILFLIAVTIVLSLIPVFLPRKDASLSNINRRKYFCYWEKKSMLSLLCRK
jgi:hypothetical protein